MSRDTVNNSWKECWNTGFAPWHISHTHYYVEKHFEAFTQGKKEGKRILVPLCGATHDLLFFHQQGLTVVGIEFSDVAIKQFFSTHNLEYTVEKVSDNCIVYSHDDRLKIFQMDLFEVTPKILGGEFDYWLDRGSLCAMQINDQKKYMDLIISLMASNGKGFMECYEYKPPSRPVPFYYDELATLLDGRYTATEVDRNGEEEYRKNTKAPMSVGEYASYVHYILEAKN